MTVTCVSHDVSLAPRLTGVHLTSGLLDRTKVPTFQQAFEGVILPVVVFDHAVRPNTSISHFLDENQEKKLHNTLE